MSSSPEEFSELRRLLALKRHETPPPGYFKDLPRRILNRIEAEESERAVPWYSRWVEAWSSDRLLAGANLLTMGGVALVAVSLGLLWVTEKEGGDTSPIANANEVGTQQIAGFPSLESRSVAPLAPSAIAPSTVWKSRIVGNVANAGGDSRWLTLAPQESETSTNEPAPRGLFEIPTGRSLSGQRVSDAIRYTPR